MKKMKKTSHQKSEERIKDSISEVEKAERSWREAKKAYLAAEEQLFGARNSPIAESLSHFLEFHQHTRK